MGLCDTEDKRNNSRSNKKLLRKHQLAPASPNCSTATRQPDGAPGGWPTLHGFGLFVSIRTCPFFAHFAKSLP